MKIHTGEKNFQCRLCNKIFTRAEVLKRHEILHSGNKTFSCGKCNYSCYFKNELTLHIKRHNNRTCDICGVPFGLRKQMLKHLEEMHNEYFNECANSDSDFLGKYKCNECEYKAYSSTALRFHNDTVHRGVCYPCDECDYKATQKSMLKQHMKRHSVH